MFVRPGMRTCSVFFGLGGITDSVLVVHSKFWYSVRWVGAGRAVNLLHVITPGLVLSNLKRFLLFLIP